MYPGQPCAGCEAPRQGVAVDLLPHFYCWEKNIIVLLLFFRVYCDKHVLKSPCKVAEQSFLCQYTFTGPIASQHWTDVRKKTSKEAVFGGGAAGTCGESVPALTVESRTWVIATEQAAPWGLSQWSTALCRSHQAAAWEAPSIKNQI